jgi:hypothetical protein
VPRPLVLGNNHMIAPINWWSGLFPVLILAPRLWWAWLSWYRARSRRQAGPWFSWTSPYACWRQSDLLWQSRQVQYCPSTRCPWRKVGGHGRSTNRHEGRYPLLPLLLKPRLMITPQPPKHAILGKPSLHTALRPLALPPTPRRDPSAPQKHAPPGPLFLRTESESRTAVT